MKSFLETAYEYYSLGVNDPYYYAPGRPSLLYSAVESYLNGDPNGKEGIDWLLGMGVDPGARATVNGYSPLFLAENKKSVFEYIINKSLEAENNNSVFYNKRAAYEAPQSNSYVKEVNPSMPTGFKQKLGDWLSRKRFRGQEKQREANINRNNAQGVLRSRKYDELTGATAANTDPRPLAKALKDMAKDLRAIGSISNAQAFLEFEENRDETVPELFNEIIKALKTFQKNPIIKDKLNTENKAKKEEKEKSKIGPYKELILNLPIHLDKISKDLKDIEISKYKSTNKNNRAVFSVKEISKIKDNLEIYANELDSLADYLLIDVNKEIESKNFKREDSKDLDQINTKAGKQLYIYNKLGELNGNLSGEVKRILSEYLVTLNKPLESSLYTSIRSRLNLETMKNKTSVDFANLLVSPKFTKGIAEAFSKYGTDGIDKFDSPEALQQLQVIAYWGYRGWDFEELRTTRMKNRAARDENGEKIKVKKEVPGWMDLEDMKEVPGWMDLEDMKEVVRSKGKNNNSPQNNKSFDTPTTDDFKDYLSALSGKITQISQEDLNKSNNPKELANLFKTLLDAQGVKGVTLDPQKITPENIKKATELLTKDKAEIQNSELGKFLQDEIKVLTGEENA